MINKFYDAHERGFDGAIINPAGYTTGHPALMAAIAICCNLMVGFRVRDAKAEAMLLPILPLIVSISFFLIADIDSPRAGLIAVYPQNLASLVESLR